MRKRIISEEQLIELYVNQKKTDVEIAKLLGLNKQTVYKTRKEYGIKRISKVDRKIFFPTDRQLQIIYGSLLGDGSFSKEKSGGHSSLSIMHGLKQKVYIHWKYNILSNLCNQPPKLCKNNTEWRFRTFSHPYFSEIRNIYYPNNIKTINKEFLDKVDLLGIATWYMDDGTLTGHKYVIRFSTNCFSLSEHELMKTWFNEKFTIQTEIRYYNKYYYLYIDKRSRRDFVNLIKPYIIDSMKYKLDLISSI